MSKKEEHKLRSDLEELIQRKEFLLDKNRPIAVEKRHRKNQRTARENIADLCDEDSFLEYGSLITAAQTTRKSKEELIQKTPADGLVTGIASVNGSLFDKENSKCLVLSYDYTVLAGTQGAFNHKKTDRLLAIANKIKKPIVFFVEGGGGRPGDVDFDPISIGGLDIMTFANYARLSGKVPRIAIVSGYCFAGNAAIAGCSDIIIATKNCALGMGGPAMIEGGGLGTFAPKTIGPADVQTKNGVIDVLVENEKEAVAAAKKYLAFFQGNLANWESEDQSKIRSLIPENRKFAYDVTKIIETLCDVDSFLELRKDFAKNIVTGFGRIEGNPIGLMANSTKHLGGAIDSDASDKMSRFMQLCNAFNIPIVSLCDTPGFMVGPEIEKTGLVRHAGRLFVNGANINVPILTVVLRKAYGLGAMAMAGGSFHESVFTIAWPSGEFGAMGLEGAVKLGFRKELEACKTEEEKNELYTKLVNELYEKGKAINAARVLEFDEVVDPADTRKWIATNLNSFNLTNENTNYIDTW